MNMTMLTPYLDAAKTLADAKWQTALGVFAQWFLKLQLFLAVAREKVRRLDWTDLAIVQGAVLLFGFFLGLCAPRRWRKCKIVILLLSVAGACAFLYRLFRDE